MIAKNTVHALCNGGKTPSCDSRKSESFCKQNRLCSWNSNVACIGKAELCSKYQTKQSCLSQYGCNWKTSPYTVGVSDDGHITINGEKRIVIGTWTPYVKEVAEDWNLFDDQNNFGTPNCCGDDNNEYYFDQGGGGCCDEITDCVSSKGDCLNSDTLNPSKKYLCYNNQWSKCTEDSDLGKEKGSYKCVFQNSKYMWIIN